MLGQSNELSTYPARGIVRPSGRKKKNAEHERTWSCKDSFMSFCIWMWKISNRWKAKTLYARCGGAKWRNNRRDNSLVKNNGSAFWCRRGRCNTLNVFWERRKIYGSLYFSRFQIQDQPPCIFLRLQNQQLKSGYNKWLKRSLWMPIGANTLYLWT